MSDDGEIIGFAHGIHLSEYLDEELSSRAREELSRSLDLDRELRQNLDALSDTVCVLNRMPRRCAPNSSVMPPQLRPMNRGRGSRSNRFDEEKLLPLEAVGYILLMGMVVFLYLSLIPPADCEIAPQRVSVAKVKE